MLQIKNVKKQYKTGDLIQTALDDVSLSLRDNEFVAILGPSGSGKTTLLNIIGGLDRYDSGDLIINGISTKKYKDRDWDSYRNHTIGFVFQSYNLIPHQSVLSNVELALTISGISRGERRKRAKEALEKVGLGSQLHKKPNQMSGGQMQRVAIARALVNNPDVLLADEPTGALDSETGIQVIELLKEVAKDRLVVMVTHNPELANQYANRIVKLKDGRVIEDSNPFEVEDSKKEAEHKNMGKAKMSFLTSLSLSFNNLRTKKGRTLLTSFAGSIGIIGISLILALSTGVNTYIEDIQRDTMISYPITLKDTTLDMRSIINKHEDMDKENNKISKNRKGVYADNTLIEATASSVAKNNLAEFKKYLDNPDSKIHKHLGKNGIVYTYNISFNAFSYDKNKTIVNSNADVDAVVGKKSPFSNNNEQMQSMFGVQSSSAKNFEELMKSVDDKPVNSVVSDNYDVLYGNWPKEYNDVVLVLDQHNSIPSSVMYQLGLITANEYKDINDKITKGQKAPEIKFDYAEICGHTFYMVPACDMYKKNADGTYTNISENTMYQNKLIENAVKLKVSGVIRVKKDAKSPSIMSAVAYSSKLTDYVIQYTDKSEIVKAQQANPQVNVLNGIKFEVPDDKSKIAETKAYISGRPVSEKAQLFQMMMMNQGGTKKSDGKTMQQAMGEEAMAKSLDKWLAETPDDAFLLSFYSQFLNVGSYDENMKAFGKVSYDSPNSINIYADSFEDKEAISNCITDYNKTVKKENRIVYTDFVAMLTESLTSIIDVITYILIAFVAVSLVVSSIMIGIITHISVMERTKEIGILRALGASKRNISQVFNAETFIIGFCAGLLGVIISMLMTIPINAIIKALVGDGSVKATLSIGYSAILVLISMIITIIGGLLPAKKAAKKDPVIALRTE